MLTNLYRIPLHPRATADEQVFFLLSQTSALARKLGEKEFSRIGITVAEYSLLRAVENTPEITASDVRKRLFVSAPSMAQLVKSLRKKNLIGIMPDKSDIRRQPMKLTPKGTAVIRRARKAIQSALQTLNIPEKVLKTLITELSILFSSLSSYGN